MLFVLEGDVGQFQLAITFHENLLWAVDQNIVDRVVLQQGFQRAKTRHLEIQILVQGLAFLAVQHDPHGFQSFGGNRVDFLTQIHLGRLFKGGEVQVVQQGLVQLQLDLGHALFALFLFVLRHSFGGLGRHGPHQ